MARPSMAPSRALTLTEELEKLEQSITLTLQEIDHNFSRAHRIVTSSILPIVEQYAKHSDTVWEGSKFWKQFFEASANVSLSGYEEAAEEDESALDENQTSNPQGAYGTPGSDANEDTVTSTEEKPMFRYEDDLEGSSLLDSPSVTVGGQASNAHGKQHRTPKAQNQEGATFAEYPSPYEALRQELEGKDRAKNLTTPGRQINPNALTPGTKPSPFVQSTQKQRHQTPNPDPLLHRVLDKTYRIQATPHTARKHGAGGGRPTSQDGSKAAPQPRSRTTLSTNPALDSSPFSPELPAPQLRSEIFGSPVRARAATGGPRTPGVSVQTRRELATLGKHNGGASASAAPFSAGGGGGGDADATGWDSDSELDVSLGISPPKTMQFHVPQSRVLQTPAREASKRIVEDLLMTAGGGSVTDELDGEQGEAVEGLGEDSPSVIRKMGEVDDSF